MKQKSTGTKRVAGRRHPGFAICVDNRGNEASLILGKAYRVIPRSDNDPSGMLRIVDEDAEDYLYNSGQFFPIELPGKIAKALLAAEEALAT